MDTPGYQAALEAIQRHTPSGGLNLRGLRLTVCPPLPPTVRRLYISDNRLTGLPELPPSLSIIECENNQLTSLPELPPRLTRLNCNNNRLTSLPKLPNSLQYLQCNNNQLTRLPELPESLDGIECVNNPFIEPFRGFVEQYQQSGDIDQLRESLDFAPIRAKGRNVSAVKQTLGRKANFPENMASYLGSFLSGKPGTLNMQTSALKRNAGVGGTRHRKSRKRRSTRRRSIRRN
jgi:Leucine-rich repeat (LRR) protein